MSLSSLPSGNLPSVSLFQGMIVTSVVCVSYLGLIHMNPVADFSGSGIT